MASPHHFQPVDELVFCPPRRGPNDEESARSVRVYLGQLNRTALRHRRPYTWGFTVYRAAYGGSDSDADAAFTLALDRIRGYADLFAHADLASRPRRPSDPPFDPAPNDELSRRFVLDVFEDPVTLVGAGVREVADRFATWVYEHCDNGAAAAPITTNTRFRACILVDQEVLDQVVQLSAPNPMNFDRAKWYCWVKVVTTWYPKPGQVGGTNAYDQGGPFWFRCAIPKLAGLWFHALDMEIDQFGEPDPEDGIITYVGPR